MNFFSKPTTAARRAVPGALVIGVATLLGACGGGGSGGSSSAGITGTGATTTTSAAVVSGTITGFGSVHVNGIHFETTSASIRKDDSVITQQELRVGQVVKVRGTIDDNGNGVATSIDFSNNVEGAITSIDLTAGTLVVLGQTVVVDANTSFDDSIVPAALASLKVGDRIEVSGLVDATGKIIASRIELGSASSSVELEGVLSTLDTVARTFKIGNQVVNYGTATLLNFASGALTSGDVVEVHGSIVGSVLIATRVKLEGADDNSASSSSNSSSSTSVKHEIEGIVTRFVSATDFDVAGKKVTTTDSTRYVNGVKADLALNSRVEVEGPVSAAGVVQATKVEFRTVASARLEANVTAVDATNNKLTVMGVVFQVNALTRFEDKSDTRIERFNLSNMSVGDHVEVRAALVNGVLTATRVEREKPSTAIALRGTVTALAQPQFTVLGLTVVTNSSTKFESDDATVNNATQFFASASGKLVSVTGTAVGTQVMASKVEVKSSDN